MLEINNTHSSSLLNKKEAVKKNKSATDDKKVKKLQVWNPARTNSTASKAAINDEIKTGEIDRKHFWNVEVKLRGNIQHSSSTRSKKLLQVFSSKFYLWCHQQKLLQKFHNKQQEDDINKSANYSLYFSSS